MNQEEYNKFQIGLSTRMQEYRNKKKGMRQEDIAKICNVSTAYISNIERGKTKIPANLVFDYCKELNVSPDIMLDYKENNSIEIQIYNEIFKLTEENKELVLQLIKGLV